MPKNTFSDQQVEKCVAQTRVVADQRSNAEYIAQVTDQLYKLANANNLELLACILGRAHLEAKAQSWKLENILRQPKYDYES